MNTRRPSIVIGALTLVVLLGAAWVRAGEPRTPPAPLPALVALPELGIEVVALHLSASGSIVDLRYRVVDPRKAAVMLRRQETPLLLDPEHGLQLSVPAMAYVGSLRQTAIEPEAGKTYFILFGNAARSVKPGSRVTLVLGDRKVEGLTVS